MRTSRVNTILVTGASGFIGQALCVEMKQRGIPVVAAYRSMDSTHIPDIPCVYVGNVNASTCWDRALHEIDTVIHLAARVHVMSETVEDPLSVFREVNVEGTRNLALACAASGVKRLIFVSSIKVNGEESRGEAFHESSPADPEGGYATSKWEAECLLREVERDTGLNVVVVRIPMVYGAGVKGNLLSLLRSVCAKKVLPLAGIHNKRSLIGLQNLVDFLICCYRHPLSRGQTFLVSDGEDISTPELVRMIARALHCPPRLVWVPVPLLRWIATIMGRNDAMRKIAGSLLIDSSFARRSLEWSPPHSMSEGIEAMGNWYTSSVKDFR